MDKQRLAELLERLSSVRLVVYGDYFLDHYLILDRTLTEISIETGLEAYQVVDTHKHPGAAGTVASNLRALGVNVLAVGLYGDDGSGYELHKALLANGVDVRGMIQVAGYATPTYMKPMMREPDGQEHELNRMDVKRRAPLEAAVEEQLITRLRSLEQEAEGILIIDQVPERNCGVVTDRARAELRRLGEANPNKTITADSREYLGLFQSVILKANLSEALRAAGLQQGDGKPAAACAERCAQALTARTGRPVVVTLGSEGMLLLPGQSQPAVTIPAVPVTGPIDIVGAGDSVNAAIGAALCAGATLEEAGQLASLVASIVIRQIGVTGTASPQQVMEQFQQLETSR